IESSESKDLIDIRNIMKQQIDSFKKIGRVFTNKDCNIEYQPDENMPLVRVVYHDFALCIDFLILFLYQKSALSGTYSKIAITSKIENEVIHLDFTTNGPSIFQYDHIVINASTGISLSKVPERDMRGLFGLYYAVLPLKKNDASIVVHSESGNNKISLLIPVIR
ncbi:MAG: hypothetical protein V1753_04130, partial [Pseudomonadota bacterium]